MKNAVTTTQHNITHTQLIETAALPPTVRQAIANIVGAQSEVTTPLHAGHTGFRVSSDFFLIVQGDFLVMPVNLLQRNCLPKERSRPCKLCQRSRADNLRGSASSAVKNQRRAPVCDP